MLKAATALLLSMVSFGEGGPPTPPPTPGPITERCFVYQAGPPTGYEYIGDRRCLRLDAPHTLQGLWINNFEGSIFVSGARKVADVHPSLKPVWLSVDDKSIVPPGWKPRGGHVYHLTFIGRSAPDLHRPAGDGGYGHLGMFNGLVLVDRLIEVTDLGPVSPSLGLGLPKVEVHEVR